MDKDKVEVIQEWEEPQNVHDVQVFLGFANFYRRFILNYLKQAAPLMNLLKKDHKKAFPLDENAKGAFENLKRAFISAPILRHFDKTKPAILETDASDGAIAGILSQRDQEGVLHPVAYWSRKMQAAELNYDIGNKEMLAMVEAIKHWRYYLKGARNRFTVFTDHQNLVRFMEVKELNRRQARWALFLSDYDFEIVYQAGSKMGKSDALTRRYEMLKRTKARDQSK
jgi:hypothetical protein